MTEKFTCVMCGAEIEAPTIDDLVQRIKTHAKEAHNITEITPDTMEMMKSKIREKWSL
ncbi:MAG: DUF1059 domain-containing protein [Candidatus Asgardarchaeia archaeon]